jgi:hypothetical protein
MVVILGDGDRLRNMTFKHPGKDTPPDAKLPRTPFVAAVLEASCNPTRFGSEGVYRA